MTDKDVDTYAHVITGRPLKYSAEAHAGFHQEINKGDKTARKVYADYLEDHGAAPAWMIHLFRHHEGPLNVGMDAKGSPMVSFIKTVNPGVVNRRGLPTTIRYENGRLSMRGHTGQTVMQFKEYDNRGHLSRRDIKPRKGWTPRTVRKLYDTWDRWHLNDMRAGTPKQTEYLKQNPPGHLNYYQDAVRSLTEAGLNPDPDTGHNYGHSWVREEIPDDVMHFLVSLPEAERKA